MIHDQPTPHEIRISRELQKIARKLKKLLARETGDSCDFILCVNSTREREKSTAPDRPAPLPIASYISTVDRHTSALMMLELIIRWETSGELPPIHELTDADGKTLAQIIGKHDH